MSAFTPSPTELEQLQEYAEEFRTRIEELTANGMEVGGYADFEGMYRILANLSVVCMSAYMSLRHIEDYINENVGLVGEDEEG